MKVCLITGATSGIGKAAAYDLARLGATVVLVGRNYERCVEVQDEIRKAVPKSDVDFLVADLSSMQQIRQLADEFLQRHTRLDVLINNAGGFFLWPRKSEDGIEMTFALNHLSYFLLTNLLLGILEKSAPSRIINVASSGHKENPLDFENLAGNIFFNGRQAYGRSKFANILFTYELARRLSHTKVTANALHPGWVATNIGKNNGILARLLIPVIQMNAISSEEGAETIIYLASSSSVEGVTGKYFYQRKPIPSDPKTYHKEDARRLWEISAEMSGLLS